MIDGDEAGLARFVLPSMSRPDLLRIFDSSAFSFVV